MLSKIKPQLAIFLCTIVTYAYPLNCKNPCGAQEIIECTAKRNNTTAEKFYNEKLFENLNIDGFCKNKSDSSLETYQQKYFFKTFCGNKNVKVLSYTNFIKATKKFPTFACDGDYVTRHKELVGFFATIAHETSSRIFNYTNDGLYFRYENGALKGNTPYKKTVYFPKSPFIVAINSKNEIYSGALWYGKPNGALEFNLNYTIESITWGKIIIPANSKLVSLNKLVLPIYWVGMGPIQLTGGVLIEFFSWYHNITNPNNHFYNLNNYFTDYLQNGEMTFSGALWFWMSHINGLKINTIHQMIINPNKPVCHDIAAITRRVNGGCTGYNPGRINYYTYFADLFYTNINPTVVTLPNKIKINSMICNKPLQIYCSNSN